MCKVAEAVLLSASAQVLTSWAWDRDPISSGLRAPGLQGSRAPGLRARPRFCLATARQMPPMGMAQDGCPSSPEVPQSAAECRMDLQARPGNQGGAAKRLKVRS